MTGPPDSWRHELALLNEELHALDADIASARAASARERHARLSFKHDERAPRKVHGEPVELPDGSAIAIRPIEPEDAGELERGLKRLSALTAFKRFRAHVTQVSPEELDHLTRIDHIRHEALAALDPADGSVSAWCAMSATPRSGRTRSSPTSLPTHGSIAASATT